MSTASIAFRTLLTSGLLIYLLIELLPDTPPKPRVQQTGWVIGVFVGLLSMLAFVVSLFTLIWSCC